MVKELIDEKNKKLESLFLALIENPTNNDEIASEIKSICCYYGDTGEFMYELFMKYSIPEILILNSCILQVLSNISNYNRKKELFNKIYELYKNNNEKFFMVFLECLKHLFKYSFNESYYGHYYLKLIEEIYHSNEQNSFVSELYSDCLEYGFYETIKAFYYNKKLYELYENNKSNKKISMNYAKMHNNIIKYSGLGVRKESVDVLENIYLNGTIEVKEMYSDSLLKLIYSENNLELKNNYLNKMEKTEEITGNLRSYNFINAFLHCISYGLPKEQNDMFLFREHSSRRVYENMKISFIKSYFHIDYYEDMENEEGDSFYEESSKYIIDMEAISDLLKKKQDELFFYDINLFTENELIFYDSLINDNEKLFFRYLLSLYNKTFNYDPTRIINFVHERKIPYIYATWNR